MCESDENADAIIAEVRQLVATVFGMPEDAVDEAGYWSNVRDAMAFLATTAWILSRELNLNHGSERGCDVAPTARLATARVLQLKPEVHGLVTRLLFGA